MTKRDFFRVLIKIFGLYSLTIALFTIIPTYFSFTAFHFDWSSFLIALGFSLLLFLLLVLLLFNADRIVTLLKLDKGFDDEHIHLGNLNDFGLLKLSCILLGGILIVHNNSPFFRNFYLSVKSRVDKSQSSGLFELPDYNLVDYVQFANSAISIFLGYILVTNYSNIAGWLLKRDKNNAKHQDAED